MVAKVSLSNFSKEVLSSNELVIVDFFTTWCEPCKRMGIILDEIKDEYNEKIKIVKLNVEEEIEIAQKYEVMSVPTILFFKNGNIVENAIGYLEKNKIVDKIENFNN